MIEETEFTPEEIEAAGGALPGNHHFYITFKTGAPGVTIPPDLRARFPDEMTIVLQNKFWDLSVGETGFSVGLSFNQVPAKLVVPYAAVVRYPSPPSAGAVAPLCSRSVIC